MKDWRRTLIGPEATLREALAAIDRSGSQIVLVVDHANHLLGTLSDGDVRRGLLRGLDLDTTVTAAMHTTPTCAHVGEDRQSILASMRRLGFHQIPVVDSSRNVVNLYLLEDFLTTPTRDEWVVIMAGGKGSRLQSLTRDTPKPMLRVGTRPLLETILMGCADRGFRRFYLAVNYLAAQIESYFGDGRGLGIEICYLREEQRRGTAGALSLFPERPTLPFVVTNADLLTKHDFAHMLDGHVESRAEATMAVREYEMQVPFGVVRERDGGIEAIEEKPVQRFVVSAGMYVLSPSCVDVVPADRPFDMPELFSALVRAGKRTRCHYVDGYWLDIGQLTDFERANLEFPENFR